MAGESILLERTGVPEEETPAYANLLSQNVPNPFNPGTRIECSLAQAGHVTLAVYDAQGRRLRVLVDELRGAGPHVVRWDGRDEAGRQLPSGVYLYRLDAPGFTQTRKMLMIE